MGGTRLQGTATTKVIVIVGQFVRDGRRAHHRGGPLAIWYQVRDIAGDRYRGALFGFRGMAMLRRRGSFSFEGITGCGSTQRTVLQKGIVGPSGFCRRVQLNRPSTALAIDARGHLFSPPEVLGN